MIPTELAAFLESGLATLVGSCSKSGQPACAHGVGICVRDAGKSARVFLPHVTAEPVLSQLREHPQIAVTLSRPETHRTVQVKGRVTRIAEADVAERGIVEELFLGYARELVFLGLPRAMILRFQRWPCWAVDFQVSSVFIQTPGPLAGTAVVPEEAR